jgi:molybdopterin-guanine dinucleotide biosynthesis protein A
MNKKSEISGFILAGGKSSRMGFDKAFLIVANKPLLQNMIDVIDPFCQSIAISGQNPVYANFHLEIIPDVFSECGPISGLYSVLKHSTTTWNLVVGVDVPFLNKELIQFLISNQGDYDCIIPIHKYGIEPLVGLYNSRIWPVVETQIGDGKFKLSKLLSELNTRYIDCNDLIGKYPKLFRNINNMEDFQNI